MSSRMAADACALWLPAWLPPISLAQLMFDDSGTLPNIGGNEALHHIGVCLGPALALAAPASAAALS
jgi:hypothetical protein